METTVVFGIGFSLGAILGAAIAWIATKPLVINISNFNGDPVVNSDIDNSETISDEAFNSDIEEKFKDSLEDDDDLDEGDDWKKNNNR